MERYFAKFPKIIYNDVQCIDITRSVKVVRSENISPLSIYPYSVAEGKRADNVASIYYDDPDYAWLVYLTNRIIDPYYGWPLTTQELVSFVTKKYGSLRAATLKTVFYRTNGSSTRTEISVAEFDALLEGNKKYFEANYGSLPQNNIPHNIQEVENEITITSTYFNEGHKIISYIRKSEEWITNTNQILTYSLANLVGTFQTEELVKINNLTSNVGGGEVLLANTSTLIIKNTNGISVPNVSYTVIGATSNAVANVTAVSFTSNNIIATETIYWEPVSYYDYEFDLNEKRRSIDLVDPALAIGAAEQLRLEMKK